MKNLKLKVSEIFYSLQGEGGRAGMPSIFIRLSGCNMNCPFCDTNHSAYITMTVEDILQEIKKYPCKTIVWTGGEPTLQLTDELVGYFILNNYFQCIETNGTHHIPVGISYITISPKNDVMNVLKTVEEHVWTIHEMRLLYPLPEALGIQNPNQVFKMFQKRVHKFYLSPQFVGVSKMDINNVYMQETIDYCKANPHWNLSIQLHKLLGIS